MFMYKHSSVGVQEMLISYLVHLPSQSCESPKLGVNSVEGLQHDFVNVM